MLIRTISPNLTKMLNEKSLYVTVSAVELMEVLFAPLQGNSDLRLKHPLEEPDFSLLTFEST